MPQRSGKITHLVKWYLFTFAKWDYFLFSTASFLSGPVLPVSLLLSITSPLGSLASWWGKRYLLADAAKACYSEDSQCWISTDLYSKVSRTGLSWSEPVNPDKNKLILIRVSVLCIYHWIKIQIRSENDLSSIRALCLALLGRGQDIRESSGVTD